MLNSNRGYIIQNIDDINSEITVIKAQTNPYRPQSSNSELWFKLDDAGPTAANSGTAGGGALLSKNNSPLFGQTFPNLSWASPCVQFTNRNQDLYGCENNDVLSGSYEGTISIWTHLTDIQENDVIVSRNVDQYGWQFVIAFSYASRQLNFSARLESVTLSGLFYDQPVYYSEFLNKTVLLTIVRRTVVGGTQFYLYINGVLRDTSPLIAYTSPWKATPNPTVIGSMYAGGDQSPLGYYSDFRISSRSMSDADIFEMYRQGTSLAKRIPAMIQILDVLKLKK